MDENNIYSTILEKDMHQKLRDNLSKLSKENLRLLKDKAVLKAQINVLKMEQSQITKSLEQPRKTDKNLLRKPYISRKKSGRKRCRVCGKSGHRKETCRQWNWKIIQAWRAGKCYLEKHEFGKVWIPKSDIYSTHVQPKRSVKPKSRDECAYVAYTSDEGGKSDDWYFDSGCSRHMTGNRDILAEISPIKGGKVTFGDGKQGKIQGVGHTENGEQPDLINVYLVDGQKANLISISQLCDEGLTVILTKIDCKALDEHGNVKLQGV